VEQEKIEPMLSAEEVLAPPSQRMVLLRRAAGPLLSVAMLCLALWALHLLAREVDYHQVRRYVQGLSKGRLLLAMLFTGFGYAVMTLYDRFGLASIGRQLPWRRVSLIAFISYAFSNAGGMSLLVSGSIRYRFYIQNGLSTGEVARVVLFCTTSFWLGLLTLSGVTLWYVALPVDFPLATLRLPAAALLTALPLSWLVLGGLVKRPLRVWRWHLSLPSVSTGIRQILVGAFDWALAASVLYVMKPDQLNQGFGFPVRPVQYPIAWKFCGRWCHCRCWRFRTCWPV
jgi:phosphatidylglycerol lysyltransferase